MSSLDGIDIIRDARTGRCSSFDRPGANADAIGVAPGEARVIADRGSGRGRRGSRPPGFWKAQNRPRRNTASG
ncbi:MAG: hypothetical protein ACYSU0_21735 [Planctomycetota bacterium]|jgi:hypothetical protein